MRYTPPKSRTSERAKGSPPGTRPSAPLGEDRFQQLMQGASAFFAAAERDKVAEKAQAIEAIQGLMAEYGLTPDDLAD